MDKLLDLLDYSICKLNTTYAKPRFIWLSLDFRYILSRFEICTVRQLSQFIPDIFYFFRETYKSQVFLFPSFTFDFPRSCLFSVFESKPETTAFASRLFRIGNIPRTVHPIYSFYTTDQASQGIINHQYYDCVGTNSIFDYLINSDTAILCIGHHFVKTFTPIHHLEYILGATYRKPVEFKGTLIGSNNIPISSSTLFFARKQLCKRSGLTYYGESMLSSQDLSCDIYYEGLKVANACYLSKAASSLLSYPLGKYISSFSCHAHESKVITNEAADLLFLA